MKKKAIFTLAACSIAVLFLTMVLVIGLWTKAGPSEKGEGKPMVYEYTWDPEEDQVTGLDISWINQVELKVTEGGQIRITESAAKALPEDRRLSLSYSGGTLKIDWQESKFFGFRIDLFRLFERGRKDLTVEVPKAVAEQLEKLSCSTVSGGIKAAGFTAEKFQFSTASGDVDLRELSGGQLSLDTTSGSLTGDGLSFSGKVSSSSTSGPTELRQAKAQELEFDTVSGKVFYSGSAEEVQGSSVSGSITAEMENCPDSGDLDSVSGRLTLAIPENDGFQAFYSSVSGSFQSDFPIPDSAKKTGQVTYGTGKAKFNFSTTSGDMRVKKS